MSGRHCGFVSGLCVTGVYAQLCVRGVCVCGRARVCVCMCLNVRTPEHASVPGIVCVCPVCVCLHAHVCT